eukprot:gnl/TRDRNA2_/TRDRNA2_74816_c0_seq1.p1 gnl/TRDRNA2_/TRDRNA2_74816_c0~~gnl/TRDRNA2_/TRDRNA2_74816_c0_seq1.p1  ORF type:complete len:415 (+),score=52.35 gnl/TRDRNA2_/TRDRNA2_74816_c0_seq1:41-1246(+)
MAAVVFMLLLAILACICMADKRILGCYYGYSQCIGVTDGDLSRPEKMRDRGCVLDANGGSNTGELTQVDRGMFVLGKSFNYTNADAVAFENMDGMPCVFDGVVLAGDLQNKDFVVQLSNGTSVNPTGFTNLPAVEHNELTTVLLLGYFGRRDGLDPVRVSALGSEYTGEGLAYQSTGPQMLYARLLCAEEHFASDGTGNVMMDQRLLLPNHCGLEHPGTTHVIQLVWSGGLHTRDGIDEPDDRHKDLFKVFADSSPLTAAQFLGLADTHDHDNYLDLCLDLSETEALERAMREMQVSITSERDQFEFLTGPKGDCMSDLVSEPCGDSRTKSQKIDVDLAGVPSQCPVASTSLPPAASTTSPVPSSSSTIGPTETSRSVPRFSSWHAVAVFILVASACSERS